VLRIVDVVIVASDAVLSTPPPRYAAFRVPVDNCGNLEKNGGVVWGPFGADPYHICAMVQ
jgi:hypothetical protein